MTLVEVVISVLIVGMITGAITSSLLTSLNIFSPTRHRVNETSDARTVASFLSRDAQAAGGTDPNTGSLDTTNNLGVSTTDAAGCSTTSGLVLRFKWFDRTPTLTAGEQNVVVHVANYYYVASSNQLVRTTCDSGPTPVTPSSATLGAPTTAVLATTVAGVTASCDPASCPSLPDTVTLAITATDKSGVSDVPTAPYTYTVTASLRPEGQTAPCDATVAGCTTPTGTIDPLITLGSSCNNGVSGLDVGGAAEVDVNGGITLSGGNINCPASNFHLGNNGSFQSGQITVVSQAVDPFAGLTPPADTCATSTGNPATTVSGGATHYHPGTYKTDPTINGNVTVVFDPGNYVFCAGLSIGSNNTNVSGTGVLLYLKGGTLNINGGTVNLTGQTTGPYAPLLVWQAAADTTSPMSLTGGSALNLNGIVYAPSVEVRLRGGSSTPFVKAIIAGNVSFSGTSGITIGTPPPQLFISSPVSLPSWTIGVPYPVTSLTATGGSGGNSWTVTGLPTGVTFDPSTNSISGTPTATGLFAPHIKLTDSDGDIALATYSVTINAAPTITGPASLPSADVTRDYPPPSKTAVMTATGGTAPYAWSATGLPPGLTIDPSSGAISGNPTAVGSYSPTIMLKDAANATDTKSYAASPIVISALPAITAPSGATLPNWTTGSSGYSQQITVTDGTGPFTWQLSAAPAGLTISNTGLITGTPTGPQTYSMVVTATDADGVAASKTYGLTINPGVSVTCSVPNGEITIPYSGSCSGTGGTPPYTYSWAAVPGLTLNPNSGAITGTPTVANTYTRTITVTDSVGGTSTKTVSFVINPAPTIATGSLPSWTINQNYGSSNTTMQGTGGLTPYVWSDGGTLPPGLSLNSATGQITGTPTLAGTYTVTVTLTDSANVQTTRSYVVTINGSPSITTTGPLPDGEQTVFYSSTMQATGGTPDAGGHYQWTISSGLPNNSGLSINATTGVISGTPNVSGSFTLTVVATDVAGATDSVQRTLLLAAPPSVTSNSLPAATRTQVGYSVTLSSSGGTGATTWTVTAGALPAGLNLSSTGVISGNVGAGATTQTFTVTATDSLGATASKSLTLTVNAPPSITTVPPLATATDTQVGYSQALAASGGTGTISWSLGAGTLPTGLNLSTGGVISGNVDAAATTQTFTVTATDSNGVSVNANFTITVRPRPMITSVALNNGGAAGTIDKGDQIVVTFSQQMHEATLCSAWTNDAADQSTTNNVTVTVSDGTGATNDAISVTTSTCTFNFGSINLGSNAYATGGSLTFGGAGNNVSTIAWTAATHTLTITLGKAGGGAAGNVASSAPVYTASGAVTDPNGVTIGNSPFTLPVGPQF
jgi:hypothetical protein